MAEILGVDLFSGAGGMSLGAIMAGIQIRVAVEIDVNAAATFKANHPETTVLNQPIQELLSLKLKKKKGDRLVVLGGPPCQGFSTSNQKTRNAANPTNWLFEHYLRVVGVLMPDWVVFENVTGISTTLGGQFLDSVANGFRKLGYSVESLTLNAQNYGVPQRRSRLFVVASLHGERLQLPPVHAGVVTVRDAIADLPSLENGASESVLPYAKPATSRYARSLRNGAKRSSNNLVTRNAEHIVARFGHVPQGGNWSDIPSEHMTTYKDASRCHTGIYHRLAYDEPSVVIGNFRKNMLIHPTEDRGLSVREAARLQSFPDSFELFGSIGFQQQQVGNAVPPRLAKAVFQSIL